MEKPVGFDVLRIKSVFTLIRNGVNKSIMNEFMYTFGLDSFC
jgi:hypothetical protein